MLWRWGIQLLTLFLFAISAVHADFLTCDRDALSLTEQITLVLDEEQV